MSDEIKRLYDKIEKLFDIVGDFQKSLNTVDSGLNSHLEVSKVRVEGYDKDLEYVKSKCDELSKELTEIKKFIIEHKTAEKTGDKIKNFIAYILGTITSILGIIAYFSWKK